MSQLKKGFQGVALLQIYDRIADIFNEQLIQSRDLFLTRLMSGEVAV